MPNWCENHLYIEATESEILAIVNTISKETGFLAYLVPEPEYGPDEEGKLPQWYQRRVDNWGTKWDPLPELVTEHPTALTLHFDSAWSPPIAALQHWQAQDSENRSFNLRFIEWGMAFCGEEDSDGTSYVVNIPANAKDCEEVIPIELDEEFGICDTVAQWDTID